MNVGFVGTGTMGAPMLGNLVKKGFGVVAYDVAPAALASAEKRGATRAESAADAARRSDLVITMLPSSSHIETAYLGKNGIAEGLAAGRLCVDMSTVDPAVSRRVAQSLAGEGRALRRRAGLRRRSARGGGNAGHHGGRRAARRRGGRPVLCAMGANVSTSAPSAAARWRKLCNNLIAGVSAVGGGRGVPDRGGLRRRLPGS